MPEPAIPKANGISCLDCDGFANYHKGHTECPYDLDHVVEPVYITDEPLGRSDDEEFHVNRDGGYYVYEAEE